MTRFGQTPLAAEVDDAAHRLELLLTTYGQEPVPEDWATADCYRYLLSLVDRP